MLSVGRIEELAVLSTEGVTEEARDAIRGTDLDKGVVLDELKKVPPEEQMDRVLIASHSRRGLTARRDFAAIREEHLSTTLVERNHLRSAATIVPPTVRIVVLRRVVCSAGPFLAHMNDRLLVLMGVENSLHDFLE